MRAPQKTSTERSRLAQSTSSVNTIIHCHGVLENTNENQASIQRYVQEHAAVYNKDFFCLVKNELSTKFDPLLQRHHIAHL